MQDKESKEKEEAYLENLSFDDHGNAIVGNRLTAPNFDLEQDQ